MLRELLEAQGETFRVATSRMENRESVFKELRMFCPTHVLLAAGKTGRPNADWCEDHKAETVRSNVIGCLNVLDLCSELGIHVTYYASGCIYQYNDEVYEGSENGFKETDAPNFAGSFYSKTKVMIENLLSAYSNVLTLRIRCPISADLINDQRNLITKLLSHKYLINVKNSMTVLPELLPLSIQMAKDRRDGLYNFNNPGCISHNEVLEMVKEYIDPDLKWKNFTVEEQSQVLKAPRCNSHLETKKVSLCFY
eukprot:g8443.t1